MLRAAIPVLLPLLLCGAGDPQPLSVRVDRAVERGVGWLRETQQPDGTFPLKAGALDDDWAGGPWQKGANALAVYALAACDLAPDDPVLVRGFRRLRRDWKSRAGIRQRPDGVSTYFVSLCLLALDAVANRDSAPLGRGPPPGGGDLPGRGDRRWVEELTTWLLEAQFEAGGFTYRSPVPRVAAPHDHSSTQFAVLGLKAAVRLGAKVPREVWRTELDHHLAAQEPKGPRVAEPPATGEESVTTSEAAEARGWAYLCPALIGPSSSMTAGGLSSLLLCRSELEGSPAFKKARARATRKGIRDGFAWLGVHFDAPRPDPKGASLADLVRAGGGLDDFYFDYSLERAGVLGGVTRIGGKDWHRLAVLEILSHQRSDGSFQSVYPSLIDTSFALLVLRRFAFHVPAPRVGADPVATPEDFGHIFARYVAADAEERKGLLPAFVRLGTGVIPRLILLLDSGEAATRAAAHEVLVRTTGRSFEASAVARWEAWWMAHRGRLEPDPKAGRFVER